MDLPSIILRFFNFITLSFSLGAHPTSALGKGEASLVPCDSPLGMEHGQIPSSRISASSSFDVKSTGPQNARIRTELLGGAWCPLLAIQEGVKEYLEIDLDTNYRLTRTETQGRFGNGMGQEFAKQFHLEYWRQSGEKWTKYKDQSRNHILDGNTNTYTAVEQILDPPIIASKIRFIPHSLHPMTVCMRVELYGCQYKDGLIHYECPEGYWSRQHPEVDLRDFSYDGEMDDDGILRRGLGLLTDSLLGGIDFKAEEKFLGNRWIGWDRGTDPVKIAFQFNTIRKFSSVSVHVNNLVSEGVQVFSSVDIYLSLDGTKFSEFPLRWTPNKELAKEQAHMVVFSLKGRLAEVIRLEFFHANYWLLISEIKFDSEPYTGNVTEEVLTLNYLQDDPTNLNSNATTTVDSSRDHNDSDIDTLGMVIGSIGLCLLCCLLLGSFIFLKSTKGKPVGDMGIGLTPRTLQDTAQFQIQYQKDNLGWTQVDDGESFYSELVYRGFQPVYEPSSFSNASSSHSTYSSNITGSTTGTTTKLNGQPCLEGHLNLDTGLRHHGQAPGLSQPSTPKSDRGPFHGCADPALPSPTSKYNRPLPATRLTCSHTGSLFTTSTSASLNPHRQNLLSSLYHTKTCTKPTNYYAATDILHHSPMQKENPPNHSRSKPLEGTASRNFTNLGILS